MLVGTIMLFLKSSRNAVRRLEGLNSAQGL